MDRRAPHPRDPVEDADPQPGVLSWLQDTARRQQPADGDAGPVMVPVAFAGRVSDKDNQDPTLSIPRQLANCRAALPDNFVIVAHFYDVESGRMDIDLRGHGRAHEEFDIAIPRDGGVADLLAEARRDNRRFVAVVCESVDRLARITYFGTKIEYELEQAGVALLAADEGITREAVPGMASARRKRATPILTRRVKQAIAEWYVINMLELSWDGLITHTDQGWNVGKPPYGYTAEVHRHPVKAKADDGRVKSRLVPDPVRGPVVTQVFRWRALQQLTYNGIAARLNLDPLRYPPPEPIPGRGRRAVGRWTSGAVREILCNPKYTGYMVWNRRKRSRPERGVPGKVNPPSEWVWSTRPTQEPLTTRDLFDAATPIGRHRERSREGSRPNNHPATRRSYRLRSYVCCAVCERRMQGKARSGGYTYIVCAVDADRHAHQPWYAEHPKSVWVREDKLLAAVRSFFAERVFGPNRRDLLAERSDKSASEADPGRLASLRAQLNAFERQQANIVGELQTYQPMGDPEVDQEWRAQLRRAFADLAAQRKAAEAELTAMTAGQRADRAPMDQALLDALPVMDTDLANLPEELERELYDCFHLQVRYHPPTHRATLRVTVNGGAMDHLTRTSQQISGQVPHSGRRTSGTGVTKREDAVDAAGFSHLLCAPNGSRNRRENDPDQDAWPILMIEEEVIYRIAAGSDSLVVSCFMR